MVQIDRILAITHGGSDNGCHLDTDITFGGSVDFDAQGAPDHISLWRGANIIFESDLALYRAELHEGPHRMLASYFTSAGDFDIEPIKEFVEKLNAKPVSCLVDRVSLMLDRQHGFLSIMLIPDGCDEASKVTAFTCSITEGGLPKVTH